MIRSAIVLKPSTLLSLHRALSKRKYRRLFSSKVPKKRGPKGPTQDVIAAVVDVKRRNPTWGCPRIAQQIALAFGIQINKDVVRRILAVRYRPEPESAGPSWLTVLGHTKDSLWSLDLFRCESVVLRTHWVSSWWTNSRVASWASAFNAAWWMARRCAGCSIGRLEATPCQNTLALTMILCIGSTNGRRICDILDVKEIKTVPYVPLSHPFVERVIGTIRRECLDRSLFWTAADLETKLLDFQRYCNGHRSHAGLDGRTPEPSTDPGGGRANVSSYRWQPHCRGLYQTPTAA